jgi:hypothetical protein
MSRQEKLAALASTGVTKAELDNIDGGTARGTTAIADGDGVLINDAGTMRMTNVTTLATYMGTKITGGSMVYLASSGVMSNVANVSFTQFDATKYDHYQFFCQNVIPVTDNVDFYALTSSDGGSNYDAGSSDYYTNNTSSGVAYGKLFTDLGSIGSDTNETGVNAMILLNSPHLATYTSVTPFGGSVVSQAGLSYNAGFGYKSGFRRISNADVDAIQFKFSSGNIESGEIVMYGIANGT